ncbi:senescence-specific cysteine protease sag39 [Cucumis melo var. makuwa]|uniref:Senescence-specific cysteine protease sag39 n=1 Tax=Cucumis melo var. makuwa TaxID=1194695 RepID=A0A5D3CXF7_CUCMM|nr:senescence-specific cysteine protease sag39 [Cucumis melo var. makuwa]TYK15938.1 senescence-specific cysteine protease sag39 [Cucumis melo var. makuwa]
MIRPKQVDCGSIGKSPERPTTRARRADALPSRSSRLIRYLESCLQEISEKAGTVDAIPCRVEGLPIQKLLARVNTLEANTNVRRTVNYECGDSSLVFAAHMEERVSELDSSQKTLLKVINGMSEDFLVTLDVVRNEIVDVNARLNLTMRAMENQAPAGGAISVSRVKIPKPKPFCGARDAKALENYIFDLEQYFKATNTVTEEAKVTLATMHLSEDAKLWWRVQDLTSAFAAAERLFDLTSDPQDVRRHQNCSLERNRNSRPSSPKVVGGDECPGKDRRPHQSNTSNTWRRPDNRSPHNRPLSYFICGRPYLARECPNKVDFHAFHVLLIADLDDKSNQAEDEVSQIDGGEKNRIGAIKYLSSLKKR